MSPKLHEVKPREQLGPVSGRAYEFQYETAAAACLQLLEDNGPTCVFCEWHDDYVLESPAAACTLYGFHQVKTKSGGAWTLSEMFGLRRKSSPEKPAHEDAAVVRLLLHFGNFSDSCDRIVLVTNASVDQNITDLLEALQHASTNDVLSSEAKTYFARLVAAYAALIAGLTAEQLFTFLKRLMVESEVGSLENRRKNYLALAWRLHELSEIDLRTTEAQKIARDLVELVRTKSHRVLALPIPDEILRRDKGVVVDDVLNVLSLSADGYRTLRKHGPGAIRTLSRLQRLCEASNVPASLIPHMCSLKSDWDIWWRAHRHTISTADFMMLQKDCEDHLDLWSDGKLTAEQVRDACADLAVTHTSLAPEGGLTKDLVFGLILALAANRGT